MNGNPPSFGGWLRIGSRIASIAIVSAGCQVTVDPNAPTARPFSLGEFIKTDTDSTLELFVEEQREAIGTLIRKLYLRNPRELSKSPGMTIERRIRQVLDFELAPRGLEHLDGVARLRRALDPNYREDRVYAFASGMTRMIDDAYDGKRSLYLLDYLDPQKLYHCARNLEIAAWKISHDVGADGKVLLVTNSMAEDEAMNLSYERLFGRMIALQDMAARIVAERSNRTIRYVGQALVFLPI